MSFSQNGLNVSSFSRNNDVIRDKMRIIEKNHRRLCFFFGFHLFLDNENESEWHNNSRRQPVDDLGGKILTGRNTTNIVFELKDHDSRGRVHVHFWGSPHEGSDPFWLCLSDGRLRVHPRPSQGHGKIAHVSSSFSILTSIRVCFQPRSFFVISVFLQGSSCPNLSFLIVRVVVIAIAL